MARLIGNLYGVVTNCGEPKNAWVWVTYSVAQDKRPFKASTQVGPNYCAYFMSTFHVLHQDPAYMMYTRLKAHQGFFPIISKT